MLQNTVTLLKINCFHYASLRCVILGKKTAHKTPNMVKTEPTTRKFLLLPKSQRHRV